MMCLAVAGSHPPVTSRYAAMVFLHALLHKLILWLTWRCWFFHFEACFLTRQNNEVSCLEMSLTMLTSQSKERKFSWHHIFPHLTVRAHSRHDQQLQLPTVFDNFTVSLINNCTLEIYWLDEYWHAWLAWVWKLGMEIIQHSALLFVVKNDSLDWRC